MRYTIINTVPRLRVDPPTPIVDENKGTSISITKIPIAINICQTIPIQITPRLTSFIKDVAVQPFRGNETAVVKAQHTMS